MMVIAMITPAITQPIAIQMPPHTIHSRLSRIDMIDMGLLRAPKPGRPASPHGECR